MTPPALTPHQQILTPSGTVVFWESFKGDEWKAKWSLQCRSSDIYKYIEWINTFSPQRSQYRQVLKTSKEASRRLWQQWVSPTWWVTQVSHWGGGHRRYPVFCIMSRLIMQLCNRWNPGSIWPVKAINGASVTRCVKDIVYRTNSATQTEGPAPPPQRSSNRPPLVSNEIYDAKIIKLACRLSLFTMRPRKFCQFLF